MTEEDTPTRWSCGQLPRELWHDDIAFHRDVGDSFREGYQIGFGQSWMPYDYRIPDGYRMHYARLERHHPPSRSRWAQMLFPKNFYVVVVVSEDHDQEPK